MRNYIAELSTQMEARKRYLEQILQMALKQEEKLKKVPEKKIHVMRCGKGFQYYLRSDSKDTSGTYIKKDEEILVRQILQKEYLQKSIRAIRKELSILDQYKKTCLPDPLISLYEKLHEGRKNMIDPLEISDEEYVKRWSSVCYSGKPFLPDTPEYFTHNMERVRSKSEIIIANTLLKYQIPYRYEYPIQIKGMGIVYPDFTVLNVKKRKEMYLEHFGLIDDMEYRNKSMRKLEYYEINDIYPGDKLIITYESSDQPLNVKSLERKIQKYLL